jgi:PAS domain S-box-containing protein
MNSPVSSLDATLHIPIARQVDEICDCFEAAWKAKQPPRIEDYLRECVDEAKPVLLRELIELDLYYRREEYRKRFPDLASGALAGGVTRTGDFVSTSSPRYSLVEFHAQGGMGRVSIYYDHEMNRHVALKELHPQLATNANILQRFLQEARITGRLEHPNIVPVYELVKPTTGRSPFYTMRFVKGRTLTEVIRLYHEKRRAGGSNAVDLLTLLNAFVSVCQTVAYAHSQGVIHRDLKGSNVVLGDFGEVIVLDWGLAKLLSSSGEGTESYGVTPESELHVQTLQGVVKGTPGYLSPEQAEGRTDRIGRHTDVYGLGAILYEILAGRPPFIGTSVAELLEQARIADPELPAAIARDVPGELQAACLRALAKSHTDRHASASELAAEVQRWLAESADRSRARQERERFFDLAHDLLCTIGSDHRFHQLNAAWEETLGWPRDELMTCDYLAYVHPEDQRAMRSEVNAVATGATRSAFENQFRCKDGRFRWISWTASLIPGEQLVYAVGRDVTERKHAEVALRRSQERFELAVRGSGDGIWDWDRETGESFYSPRWKSMIGYEDHEITHDLAEWETRLHPDDRDRALAALRSCTDGGTTAFEVEYRFRHRDGSYRWILDRGIAVRGATGVTRMAGSHTDITERKRMEQELRDGEVRHQTALAEIVADLARCRGE